jgi:hypothetical protein
MARNRGSVKRPHRTLVSAPKREWNNQKVILPACGHIAPAQ